MTDERRDDRGEDSGHVFGAEDALAHLRGLAAAVADHLNVGGKEFSQPVDVAVLERVEESLGKVLAFPSVVNRAGRLRGTLAAGNRPREELLRGFRLPRGSKGPEEVLLDGLADVLDHGVPVQPGDRLEPQHGAGKCEAEKL